MPDLNYPREECAQELYNADGDRAIAQLGPNHTSYSIGFRKMMGPKIDPTTP